MKTVVLSTTYFGPIQWYQKLHRYDCSVVSREERFRKQSYRNRCVIATANGLQALTVPVVHDAGKDIGTLRVSEHGNWRHVHWNALCSAYGDSPFFQYYADDIRPFFESRWEYLYDLNMAITVKMCELLDIHPNITDRLDGDVQGSVDDLTDAIDPKHGSVFHGATIRCMSGATVSSPISAFLICSSTRATKVCSICEEKECSLTC